ncbi:SRPBCC family protein [Pelagibacterium mangrovi]|uniref:SRPBCC family protein n=1 Tax=Pelagibacterium mangrovi TaxID=3119828 RepID=UPI002FC6BBF3
MSGKSLSLVREFDSPIEDVYRAWTDPERLAQWVGEVDAADVRVGGAYRFVNDDGQGGQFIHHGQYLELVPDRKIVMTFKAGQVEDNPYQNETIAIELVALDGRRTELTLTNRWDGPAMGDEDIEATKQGWSAWLDLLAEALA